MSEIVWFLGGVVCGIVGVCASALWHGWRQRASMAKHEAALAVERFLERHDTQDAEEPHTEVVFTFEDGTATTARVQWPERES